MRNYQYEYLHCICWNDVFCSKEAVFLIPFMFTITKSEMKNTQNMVATSEISHVRKKETKCDIKLKNTIILPPKRKTKQIKIKQNKRYWTDQFFHKIKGRVRKFTFDHMQFCTARLHSKQNFLANQSAIILGSHFSKCNN